MNSKFSCFLAAFVGLLPLHPLASADADTGDHGFAAGGSSDDSVTVSGWYKDSLAVPGLTASGNWGSSGSGVDAAWGSAASGPGTSGAVSVADVGCSAQIGTGIWSRDDCPLIGPATSSTDPALDPDASTFVAPSTWDILQQGLATAVIPGAGIVVQPNGDSYVGVPTLVHASATSQTVGVVVLGIEVPIHLTAQSFSFDFGDGSPPLVTTDPGAAYPVRTNQHTYEDPLGAVTVSLQTTWTASVVNPFTGGALTVDGMVVTREQSRTFAVVKAHTVVTDLAEERLGR